MTAASPLTLPARLSPTARLYLAPVGIAPQRELSTMIAAGAALPLAGGPLAFAACEVAIRDQRIERLTASVADVTAWASRLGGTAADRLRLLLDQLSRPRVSAGGEPFLHPRVMGVINATPDSFSDGGDHLDPAAAIAHGHRLAESGADILDVGGESTRPGGEAVEPAIEIARVMPVLHGLASMRAGFPGLRLSIDSRHAAVMRAALTAGVDILNDVTALTGDADSLAVAAGCNADVILMHMQGQPGTMNRAPAYDDVALDVFDYLESRIDACIAAGIDRRRLIVDPGIGFGKRGPQNLAVLRSLPLYHGLGCPILLGVSRKELGSQSERGLPPKERLPVSLAAAMHALDRGVQMLRVHDIAETRRIIGLWQRLNDGGP
ncbi:MAG TPA: dihydropteroate synthase [Methylomirabilota bacterium]|nr:dihydropteroate synthase [Methylomirabilota bacterium]